VDLHKDLQIAVKNDKRKVLENSGINNNLEEGRFFDENINDEKVRFDGTVICVVRVLRKCNP